MQTTRGDPGIIKPGNGVVIVNRTYTAGPIERPGHSGVNMNDKTEAKTGNNNAIQDYLTWVAAACSSTEASPFFGWLFLPRGKMISLERYSFSRATLALNVSSCASSVTKGRAADHVLRLSSTLRATFVTETHSRQRFTANQKSGTRQLPRTAVASNQGHVILLGPSSTR